MTKLQATQLFKQEIVPLIIVKYGKDDKVAISEAWNIWTDYLCKDGEITSKQYDSWSSPF